MRWEMNCINELVGSATWAGTAAGPVNQIEGVVVDNNYVLGPVPGQAVSAANMWYHVVLSYDGSLTTMYVNGASIGTRSGAVPRNDGPITIARIRRSVGIPVCGLRE